MKKLLHVFAVALLVSSSTLFVPTQDAEAFFTSWMPWNWMRGWGNDYYPYYGGYGGYPYWGGGYPHWGGYPYRGWW